MPQITDLLTDIEGVVNKTKAPNGEILVPANRYSRHVADLLSTPAAREHKPMSLYASKIGKNCLLQMWYGQWYPEKAEPLRYNTLVKFTYGDLVEEFALDLVRAANHELKHEQTRIEFPTHNGFTVSGRLDAVIDGYVVDVKSTSPYSYNDWVGRPLTAANDTFGYRWQLHTYGRAAQLGQIDANTERGYLLLVDKQNGHVGLSWVDYDWDSFDFRLKIATEAIGNDPSKQRPHRGFDAVDNDKLGNKKLCTECSYCDYKRACWEKHDIKGVVRAGKVVWLVAPTAGTKVRLKPGELELPA